MNGESANLFRSQVPEQKAQDTPRDRSGTDGQADSLAAVGEEKVAHYLPRAQNGVSVLKSPHLSSVVLRHILKPALDRRSTVAALPVCEPRQYALAHTLCKSRDRSCWF